MHESGLVGMLTDDVGIGPLAPLLYAVSEGAEITAAELVVAGWWFGSSLQDERCSRRLVSRVVAARPLQRILQFPGASRRGRNTGVAPTFEGVFEQPTCDERGKSPCIS